MNREVRDDRVVVRQADGSLECRPFVVWQFRETLLLERRERPGDRPARGVDVLGEFGVSAGPRSSR
ncbi:hypothetical protein D8S78_13615 [Natrialba swarupiae]|nr:hypothetical protein [Natrialba swarupiae]